MSSFVMQEIDKAPKNGTIILIPSFVICHAPIGQWLSEEPKLVSWGQSSHADIEGWLDSDSYLYEPEYFFHLPVLATPSIPTGSSH